MITIRTSVEKIEEKVRIARSRKVGGEVIVENESLGWFASLVGSHVSIFLGSDSNGISPGDPVVITIGR